MNKFIAEVYVEITRVTDDSGYPDLVEFALTDTDGRRHIFHDKLPVVSAEDEVKPPCAGALRCHIIGEKENSYLIDTSFPDYVETDGEEYIFEVVKDLVIKLFPI
ncbi:MAG: hypothetical protein K6B74_02415 [Ruminococcus sp.]|nr:hypothetical protein [Ruminococcus sp.]